MIWASENEQINVTASETLTDSDFIGGILKKVESGTEVAITVPAGLTNKELCTFIQTNLGKISFVADTGVTILSADNAKKTRTRYSSATLIPVKDTVNVYYLVGDLEV